MQAAIAAVSAALLMTELALTRIFSVTMYYHFAFLAISIALFGLSASGVAVYLARRRLAVIDARILLAAAALTHALATLLSLACLVRIRVGLNYSPENLELMLAIYALAALPFYTGGAVMSLAFARLTDRINVLYAADLIGAAAGCLVLIPLLNWLGAPGVVMTAAALSTAAAVGFAPSPRRGRFATLAVTLIGAAISAQLAGAAPFDVIDTKGHVGDRVLFSKWNSFSRVAVYDRPHGDWSLSPKFAGTRAPSLFMDIDSAASTPILKGSGHIEDASYLRYELTAIGYHLVEPDFARSASSGKPGGFTALSLGPGCDPAFLSALGLRRAAARVARAGRLCRPRHRCVEPAGHRPLRPCRHLPAEEAAVHAGTGGAAARRQRTAWLRGALRPGPAAGAPGRRSDRDAADGHDRGGLPAADSRQQPAAVPRRLSARRIVHDR